MRKLLLRLLIGGLFAIFGLLNYYSNVDVNPVTGEKQRVQLSPQQEQVIGLQARGEVAQQHGGLYPDEQLQGYVDAVGKELIENTTAARAPYQFEFHLLRDPETINAFALPGGQVFITAALLAQMNTEAQLAAVLGHEIGHVIGRHGAEHIAKQQLGVSLVNAIGVAASDDYGSGRNAAAIAQAVNQLLSLQYGREDELESDRLGFEFMTEAGYDPLGIVELMDILASANQRGGAPPEFLSTHPNPGNRAAQLTAMIQARFPGGVPAELQDYRDRFAQIVGPRLR